MTLTFNRPQIRLMIVVLRSWASISLVYFYLHSWTGHESRTLTFMNDRQRKKSGDGNDVYTITKNLCIILCKSVPILIERDAVVGGGGQTNNKVFFKHLYGKRVKGNFMFLLYFCHIVKSFWIHLVDVNTKFTKKLSYFKFCFHKKNTIWHTGIYMLYFNE